MRTWVLAVLAVFWAGAAFGAEQPKYGPPPAWVKPAEIPAPGGDESGPTQVLVNDAQIRFNDGGFESYARGALKIRTVQGLAAAGNVALMWRPETDTLTIHHLHVLRDGEVIDVLARGETFTVLRREQNLEQSMLDGILTASIQPAGLQVRDIVDFAITIDRRDPLIGGRIDRASGDMLASPSRRLRIRALWPKGRAARWRLGEGMPKPKLSTSGGESEFLIDLTDTQPVKTPDGAPARFGAVGFVELTEFAGWRDISAMMAPYFAKAITLAPDSPLKAEAAN